MTTIIPSHTSSISMVVQEDGSWYYGGFFVFLGLFLLCLIIIGLLMIRLRIMGNTTDSNIVGYNKRNERIIINPNREEDKILIREAIKLHFPQYANSENLYENVIPEVPKRRNRGDERTRQEAEAMLETNNESIYTISPDV